MLYQWKIPDLYRVPAQDAGKEIESCKDMDGFIKPEAVVEKARAETSAIHGCFEWDDQSAASRFRLHQAGELIRNIVTVEIGDSGQASAPVRAFVNIKGASDRGYKTISAVVHNHDDYEYMLTCAKNELRAFTTKYAVLSELRPLMSAIQEVLM